MQKIFRPARIFTGREWLSDKAVIVSDGLIEKIISSDEVEDLPSSAREAQLLMVPAFIDAQVYGAGKRLFSVYPEAATLRLMNEIFRSQGTVLFVPTLATNTIEVFRKGIDAVRAYWQEGGKGVAGIHLEGPWINEGKKGAHVKDLIHTPSKEEVTELLEYGKGVIKMITLAPEVCDEKIVQLLLSEGIVVSAGHSNASYEEAVQSFDKGIPAVTHLFNAMSPLHHRGPGLVGAAMDHASVRASIIPDGHHVDYAAISVAKKIMKERLFAITDAVTDTETGPYRHQLNGDKYECNGVLSGSALSMHQAFLNLVQKVGVDLDEALRMCSLYPAELLGCDHRYGRIGPQCTGDFLLLDKQLQMVELVTG